jgi:hypothetical protein
MARPVKLYNHSLAPNPRRVRIFAAESRKGKRRDDAGDHASKKSECDHDGRHEISMPISARERTVGAPARRLIDTIS